MARSFLKTLGDMGKGATVYGAKGARLGANIHPIGVVAGAKAGAVAGAVRAALDEDWADTGVNDAAYSESRARGKQNLDDIDF